MMNKTKIICVLIILIGITHGIIYGQQSPTYSQYMLNPLINPAAAGSEGVTAINMVGREQWVGFPGTPSTYTFTAETRVLKNSFISKALKLRKKFSKRSVGGRVGLGINTYVDRSGPISQTGLKLTYAYHIQLRQSLLSFGLSFSGFDYNVDYSKLRFASTDQTVNGNLSKFVIDGNFGIQYTNPLFMAGFSVANLSHSHFYFLSNAASSGILLDRTYNLMANYKIEIDRDFLLQPSTLLTFTESGALVYSLSSRLYYRDDYWGGLSYRTGANGGALIFLMGMRVNKLSFGYSFDYSFSPIQNYSYGSHEFTIIMKFGENARRYRWLNRY